MTTAKFDYGMNTDIGNNTVHEIVLVAISKKLAWSKVLTMLLEISTVAGFERATDTEVRKKVYNKLF
jgi:hypothetical protein